MQMVEVSVARGQYTTMGSLILVDTYWERETQNCTKKRRGANIQPCTKKVGEIDNLKETCQLITCLYPIC